MGRIAAQCVLNRLHGTERFREEITVEPELVVRESTQAIERPDRSSSGRKSKLSRKPRNTVIHAD
jgi:hypothetical protein